MPHRQSYPGGARSLKIHLDRLRQLLDALTDRLRDGVARAVGETVAVSVTSALRDAFGQRDASQYGEYGRPQQGWYDERDDADYWPHPTPYERDPYDDDEDEDEEAATHRSQGDSTQSWRQWRLALALACQAAAWWLRGQITHYPISAALGVGLTSALAAYLGGPLVAAGAGLGGSTLSLAWLAELVGSAAALLLALQRF